MDLDLSDWKDIYKNYRYADAQPIRKKIREKGLTATPDDSDIINQIALWKFDRVIDIAGETIEFLNSIARHIQSPEDVLRDTGVAELINELLNSKGVGLPLASTILKFYQPRAFPIIDQRAYRQIFGEKLPIKAGVKIYIKYVKKCVEIGKRFKIPFEKVDEVLYQKDKNEGNVLNGK